MLTGFLVQTVILIRHPPHNARSDTHIHIHLVSLPRILLYLVSPLLQRQRQRVAGLGTRYSLYGKTADVVRTVFSTIIKDKYGLSELQIGLCYLSVPFSVPVPVQVSVATPAHIPFPSSNPKAASHRGSNKRGQADEKIFRPAGFGSILSSYLNGLQMDYHYRQELKRAGGDFRKMGEEFKIEWTRLRCLIPFAT